MGESASSGGSTNTAVRQAAGAPRRRLTLWVVGLALGLLAGFVGVQAARTRSPVAGRVVWHDSVEAALERARDEQKLLHVRFTQADRPLSTAMDATLALPMLEQMARIHYVNLRLDAQTHPELFRRWIGSQGALASCILDVSAAPAGNDVVAVAAGFTEPDRYLEFLDSAVKTSARLRQLRREAERSGAARVALGDLYLAQGSQQRARESFAAVLAPPAAKAEALARLVRLELNDGRTVQARGLLLQARALDTASGSLSANHLELSEALILSSERRVSDAVTTLLRLLPSLAAGPERAQTRFTLGTLQHELKRDGEALESLAQVVRESPSSTWARQAETSIVHIKNPTEQHTH